MAVFLLRISFRNQPNSSDFLLTGRVYPPSTHIKAGDWLLLGEMKVPVKQVVSTDYQGVMLTIGQDSVETLRRSGIALTKLYGTEIPVESAAE
ncbi:MAG: hypothetical protein EOO56_16890 [Hymenobacter sp.]|nr:MAG: hypothetical protein EOO56_16890 [Hymenobacter sp.]